MKKFEVKHIDLKNIFLGTVSFVTLPCIVMGTLAIICSIVEKNGELLTYGVVYSCVYPIILGIISVIFGLSYNVLSEKIGCLKISLNEIDDEE